MMRFLPTLLAVLAVAAVGTASAATLRGATSSAYRVAKKAPEYIEGAYLVRMKDSVSVEDMRETKAYVQSMHDSPFSKKLGRVTHMEARTVMKAFELLDANQEMVDFVANLEGVRAVTQQTILRVVETADSWGQDRIDQATEPLDGQYNYVYDGTGVDVYVIDSGIDTNHEDFGGNTRTVENIYDAYASDKTNPSADTDQNGHGSHTSGTVGGLTHGVSPNANVYGVRVMNRLGFGSTSNIVAGIDFATETAATTGRRSVFSMSIGGSCGTTAQCASDPINEAVNAAVDTGVAVSVAAGNDADDACTYSPASASKVVTVGATDKNDNAASYTNYGSCVDIMAPGSAISSVCAYTSCHDETSYVDESGTSMATPHVSGVLAQYFQANPNATPDDAKQALQCSSSKDQINFRTASGDAVNYMLQIVDSSTTSNCRL